VEAAAGDRVEVAIGEHQRGRAEITAGLGWIGRHRLLGEVGQVHRGLRALDSNPLLSALVAGLSSLGSGSTSRNLNRETSDFGYSMNDVTSVASAAGCSSSARWPQFGTISRRALGSN